MNLYEVTAVIEALEKEALPEDVELVNIYKRKRAEVVDQLNHDLKLHFTLTDYLTIGEKNGQLKQAYKHTNCK